MSRGSEIGKEENRVGVCICNFYNADFRTISAMVKLESVCRYSADFRTVSVIVKLGWYRIANSIPMLMDEG